MRTRDTISASVQFNAGKALKEQHRFLEAAEHFHRTLAIDPTDAEAAYLLANCLKELGSLEESLVAYDAALALRPAMPDALTNKGVVLRRLGDPEGAVQCLRSAIALHPGHAEAHWNLSLALLLTGAEEEGWKEYEWRWSLPSFPNFGRLPTAPRWDGRIVPSGSVLLRTEQGFGDSIQFARYIPLVAERCGRVVVECPEELARLFSSLGGEPRVVTAGSPLPVHAFESPLMSLPGLPGFAPSSRRWTVPYIRSEHALSRHWGNRLSRSGGPRVGLVWGGRIGPGSDAERSLALEQLLPLSAVQGVSWISLQQGGARVQREGLAWEMMDAGPLLGNFAETAALLEHLDLVICIDSAVAHLAGAMGKTVWMMIPFAPDWRWGIGVSATPWYPTMRLFRQTTRGSWDAVVHPLSAALRSFVVRTEETVRLPVRVSTAAQETADLIRKGNRAFETGDYATAEQIFREATRADETLPAAWFNLGNALMHLQRYGESIECYQKARALDPDEHAVLHNLGIALGAMKEYDASIRMLTAAVERLPSSAEYLNSLGNAYGEKGEHEKAITCYGRALEIAPESAHIHYNTGEEFLKLWRLQEAAASYRRSIQLDSDYLPAYHNLGHALLCDRRVDEAIATYERGLAIAPGDLELRWNLAQAYLLAGDYVRGWRLYEDRWRTQQFRPHRRVFPFPEWDGSSLEGKTILLYTEQGFGDALQFARYAEVLASGGACVVVECPAELVRLFRGIRGVSGVITTGDPPGTVDAVCPLMSLPAKLGTTLETIPPVVPYLDIDIGLLEEWRQRVGGDDGRLRVGIVWNGRTGRWNEKHRSLALQDLIPLADIPGVSLFSLQLGSAAAQVGRIRGRQPVIDLTGEIRDFADTAALILNLDCVVGIDTAVIHLAGALGKPVWTLLPYAADWRWLLDRDDTPWYPTMSLCRQREAGMWEPVLRDLYSTFEKVVREGLPDTLHAPAEPGRIVALNTAGMRLLQQGEPLEARRCFQQALRNAPCHAVLLNNIGVTLQESRNTSSELVWFRAAVRANHALVDAHWNLAQAALAAGLLEEGWAEYEWRWLKPDFTSPRVDFHRPLWRGGPLAGRSLLIHAEQGFGDTLQFCRYLRHPRLAGGDHVFMVQPRLQELMRASFPEVHVIAWGDPVPHTSLHVPLMSIPGIAGTTLETVPAVTPYLTVPGSSAEQWYRTISRPAGGLAAGLVWRGRSGQRMDRRRSAGLPALRALAGIEGVTWYSLQMGEARRDLDEVEGMRDSVRDLSAELQNFADTAAVVDALDVIVTVDTAVAHLAGALGKPVLMLLSTPADWRWLRDRDTSPWYPTVRLFRQENPGEWKEPVSAAVAAIRQLRERTFRDGGRG